MGSPDPQALLSMGTVQWSHSWVAGSGGKPDVVCIYSQSPKESPSFMVHGMWYREELALPRISSVMTSLQEIFTEQNRTGSGRTGSNFSCFNHFIKKLQYFSHLSAKLHVSFTSLMVALKKFLADGSSFHVASSPAPQALLSCRSALFIKIFFCCSDAYHCLWVVSQIPGQSLMNVILWHSAFHPIARCLPARLL